MDDVLQNRDHGLGKVTQNRQAKIRRMILITEGAGAPTRKWRILLQRRCKLRMSRHRIEIDLRTKIRTLYPISIEIFHIERFYIHCLYVEYLFANKNYLCNKVGY